MLDEICYSNDCEINNNFGIKDLKVGECSGGQTGHRTSYWQLFPLRFTVGFLVTYSATNLTVWSAETMPFFKGKGL